MKVKTNIKINDYQTAKVAMKIDDDADFKKAVLENLTREQAKPYFVIWFDKERGWCRASGKAIKDSLVVKRNVFSLIRGYLEELKNE